MNLAGGIVDDDNNNNNNNQQHQQQQQQQLLLLQPPHRPPPSNCELHPDEVVTGFCASCLRDRLTALEPSSVNSSTRRKSTSSAVKFLFSRATTAASAAAASSFNTKVDSSSSNHHYSSAADLRRCKSFSAAAHRHDFLSSSSFVPQRHSCDVRGRSTLFALFHQDDRERIAAAAPQRDNDLEPSAATVLEEDDDDEIRAAELEPEPDITEVRNPSGCGEEIPAGATGVIEEEEAKPMKEHIGMESLSKKPPAPPQRDFKEIAGSFWVAASVFSKKLQKWRRKQKLKKEQFSKNNNNSATANFTLTERPQSSRRFNYTQSEVGVDSGGRRSCDIAPRFSLDAGRMSFDEPRFSWDEPRASWDGYLIGGGRSAFPRLPPMHSVVEDDPAPPIVQRSDGQIPVEEDSMIPGCTSQTRDYYLDSSSQRRRRSLDRSNSCRRAPLELSSNEPKPTAASSDLFNSCYNGDDRSESFESVFRDSQKTSTNSSKKSKRWSIWGFIHWRSGGGRGGGGGSGGGAEPNVVERSFSESWPELRRNGINGNLLRCNSNVSSRHSFSSSNSGFGSARCRHVDINGHGRKKRDELVLERNRSARYSPNDVDNNGLLRFYLTPLRGSRRNGASSSIPTTGKNSYKSSESFTRTMLRMY